MGSHNFPILIITIMLIICKSTIAISGDFHPTLSFYDILEANGLPRGLFPKGISKFSLDPTTARFHLHFLSPSPCTAKFETHIRYKCEITGSLSYGKIADLCGVDAQELFLWLPVKAIEVDIPSSGLIYFDVGMVFKQFSLSFFETPKDCNALAENEGGDDVVLFYDRIENKSGEIARNHFTSEEQRAIS